MMKEIIIDVSDDLTAEEVKEVIDEICKNGIGKGCFKDYSVLAEVVQIFAKITYALKEKK